MSNSGSGGPPPQNQADKKKADVDPSLQRRIDKDYAYFEKAVKGESDGGKILKCHTLTEYYMDKILTCLLPQANYLLDDDRVAIGYFQKVAIIKALGGVDLQALDSLTNLNRIRNKLAHELDYQVSENDVDRIGRPLGKEYIQLKKDAKNMPDLLEETLFVVFVKVGRALMHLETQN